MLFLLRVPAVLALAFVSILSANAGEPNIPPAGFTALFNGKNMDGWRGGDTEDHRALLEMPADKREAQIKAWTDDMLLHWKVENGELLNDGQGKYATTEKEYGDFELLVEYNMAPKGDSGIYLRNAPQVQIWDHTDPDPNGELGRAKGSGGLWNNTPGTPGKDPLVLADKPAGEWNQFRILMTGSRVSVWLNDKLVVDHASLENYYNRSAPVPARGPICLQTHGAPIQWRNVFIREISGDEANKILAAPYADKFHSIFNGKDLTGWQGASAEYEVADGAIRCKEGKGGVLYTTEEYSDFTVRLEFKLPPGGNNGLAIRYPGQGDPAFEAFAELQILDDDYPKYAKLDPRQFSGSLYGMIAAHRGYLRQTGEWNIKEVIVRGSRVRVELNGVIIMQGDVSKLKMDKTMHYRPLPPESIKAADGTVTPNPEYEKEMKNRPVNYPHPGIALTKGFFGFAGHNEPVEFREVKIIKLK